MLQRTGLEKGKEKTALESLGPLIYQSLPFVGLHPHPCSKHVHAKTKEISQQTSKETHRRRSMIKTSQEKTPNKGKQTYEAYKGGKQACYQTKEGVIGGQMQVWIECPQFHLIEVRMTHKLMHEHVGKHAKKQRKPNKRHKASKASISTSHGVKKSVNQADQHHRGVSHKWLHPNKPQEGRM